MKRFTIILLIVAVLIIALLAAATIFLLLKNKRLKRTIAETKFAKEKYRISTELADDILFEYNVITDVMTNSIRYEEEFGHNAVIYNYTELMVNKKYIHPDDRKIYKDYCNDIHIGKENIEYEFRIQNTSSQYVWCKIKAKTVYGGDGLPATVVGNIINVEQEKRQLELLTYKAQRDPLTNAYNKGATKEKIDEILRNSKPYEHHALFLIDIDDFKHVNDTYGHLMGDKVLKNVIAHADCLFRKEDIVGRIGGDEFVILMRNVSSKQKIEWKAASLEQAFLNNSRRDDDLVDVSGSVGIAVFPGDGETYEELVEHADKALYKVKQQGKNNYVFYNEN